MARTILTKATRNNQSGLAANDLLLIRVIAKMKRFLLHMIIIALNDCSEISLQPLNRYHVNGRQGNIGQSTALGRITFRRNISDQDTFVSKKCATMKPSVSNDDNCGERNFSTKQKQLPSRIHHVTSMLRACRSILLVPKI